VSQLQDVHRQEPVRRTAGQLLEGAVDLDDRAVEGQAPKGHRRLGEERVEARLGFPKRLGHGLSGDRVAQCPVQLRRPDLALQQVVLGALLKGLAAHVIVVVAGEHHDGKAGDGMQQRVEGGEAAGVGQVEVEEGDVRPGVAHRLHRLLQRLGAQDGEALALVVGRERILDQGEVAGVVLHHQDGRGGEGAAVAAAPGPQSSAGAHERAGGSSAARNQ
jgi:hypothetical protein